MALEAATVEDAAAAPARQVLNGVALAVGVSTSMAGEPRDDEGDDKDLKAQRQELDAYYERMYARLLARPISRRMAVRPQKSEAKQGVDPGRVLSSHIGSLSTLVIFTLVVLKVLVVAHLDRTTALGLASEGGTAALLTGTIMSTLGPLMFLCAAVSRALHESALVFVDKKPLLNLATLAFSLVVVGFGSARLIPAVFLAFAVHPLFRHGTVRIHRWVVREGRRRGHADWSVEAERRRRDAARGLTEATVARWGTAALIVLFTAGAMWFFLSDDPWLPAERVTSDVHGPVIGFVLKTSPEATVVLQDSPRQLVRIEGKVRRAVCFAERPMLGSRPLPTLFIDPPSYPECKQLGP